MELVTETSNKTYKHTGAGAAVGLNLIFNYQKPGPGGEPFALHCSAWSDDGNGGNAAFYYVHGKKHPTANYSPEIEPTVALRDYAADRFAEIIAENE